MLLEFFTDIIQRFPYFLRSGALFRTEIRRGALSSQLNQRHVCAYLAALRSIILAPYTASQNAAGAKEFLPSTYLYSVHGRTNSQFSDLVIFILFYFQSLCGALGDASRSTWRCFAEHLVLR